MNERELTEVFRRLGAREPESWAASQVNEGINQLDRFLFLKGAWDRIVSDGDTTWIDSYCEAFPPGSTEPFAGGAHALRRLLAGGADPQDIAELARNLLAEYLFNITYLMDDPESVTGNEGLSSWCLSKLDDDYRPVAEISGLHESVLDTDPSGREMRPRED